MVRTVEHVFVCTVFLRNVLTVIAFALKCLEISTFPATVNPLICRVSQNIIERMYQF